ncbi:MAG: antA/AntB antirepressor family protein [Candidatus Competibacter sp.]|jgi:phage anti-repressor protein
MTNPLIPIVSGQINGQPTLTVDARELHACLGVAAHFKDWIVRRIDDYGFIENQDFEVLLKFEQNPQGGRPAKEYSLSLDMAKELAMVERTDKGRMVRRYFIDCERLARGQQADLSKLKAQRDALFAWLLELKPELGKIARFRRAGLNRLETARALGWGEKRVRLAETKLAAAGLLPPRESPQLSLLEG